MVKCPKCGAEYSEAVKFCSECGAKIEEPSASKAAGRDFFGRDYNDNSTNYNTYEADRDETKKVTACGICGKK